MAEQRLPKGSNRDAGGRFLKGCQPGPGNPHGQRVAKLRIALLRAVKPGDVAAMVRKLIDQGKQGDVAAARLIFDRCLGRAEALDVFHHNEPAEAETVRVVFDDNWYGNADRLEKIREAEEKKSGD